MFYFKKIKFLIYYLIILFFVFCFNGCLTYESKEYFYRLDSGNSGHGIIKYINLMTNSLYDSTGTADTDFQELMDSYYTGDKIEEELAGAKNVKKRLYEEDNRLCGEVSFDFDDITKMKFYKYDDTDILSNSVGTKLWCYYLSSGSMMGMTGNNEVYFSSNGKYGGENMPVIFWKGNQKEFGFKTTVTSPGKSTTGLLEKWKDNKKQ